MQAEAEGDQPLGTTYTWSTDRNPDVENSTNHLAVKDPPGGNDRIAQIKGSGTSTAVDDSLIKCTYTLNGVPCVSENSIKEWSRTPQLEPDGWQGGAWHSDVAKYKLGYPGFTTWYVYDIQDQFDNAGMVCHAAEVAANWQDDYPGGTDW